MKSIIILFTFIGFSVAQGANRINFLEIGQFECEGKEVSNYTYITRYSNNQDCYGDYAGPDTDLLISSQQNSRINVVIELKILVTSLFPSGAYYQYEVLYLGKGGNLDGKFAYLKEIGLKPGYLKKCSSVLGYSYTLTKSQILLIAEELDPNIFLNPTGAFQPFKKTATTICHGRSITV